MEVLIAVMALCEADVITKINSSISTTTTTTTTTIANEREHMELLTETEILLCYNI